MAADVIEPPVPSVSTYSAPEVTSRLRKWAER